MSTFALSDSQATLENVGGKGTSLAKLARAGIPVPNGFHITTEAYRQFVAANHLQTKILSAVTDAIWHWLFIQMSQILDLKLQKETPGAV